jgi:hypothetical protein
MFQLICWLVQLFSLCPRYKHSASVCVCVYVCMYVCMYIMWRFWLNTNIIYRLFLRKYEKAFLLWRIQSLGMASSRMLRRVALVRTDVSDERNAPIIRVTWIIELGTLAVTTNRCTHFFAACVGLLVAANVPSSRILSRWILQWVYWQKDKKITKTGWAFVCTKFH